MPSTLLNVNFAAEGTLSNGFRVEALGGNLYRVMEIPFLLESVSYRDVIELTPGKDDTYKFVAVKERAEWRRFDFLISKEDANAEPEHLTEVLSRAIAEGGMWERALGGWLSVVMPPDSTWDPTHEIRGQPVV